MTADAVRKGIYRRLENLRRRHPANYAQLCTAAFPKPPSYVVEAGPKHPWWASQEAKDFYDSLNEQTIHQ